MAAAQLGYKCHVYAPDPGPPAAQVAAQFTQHNLTTRRRCAVGSDCRLATFEFENIAAGPLAALTAETGLFPPRRALEIAQDRLEEKRFILDHGGRPAPFAPVDGAEGLAAALAQLGTPAILKTRRFGYDGKGQVRIESAGDAAAAWEAVHGAPSILEGWVGFDAEFSILLCRSADGEVALWDSPHNIHSGGILDRSIVPAGDSLQPAIAQAEALARRVAEALDYVGVLALEFFAVGAEAVFNEMAPRVHNSGHWTIEGALTSQFENHVRAICGLPLGATGRAAPRVEMRNLIGDDVAAWRELLADRSAHLHLYGKKEARARAQDGACDAADG